MRLFILPVALALAACGRDGGETHPVRQELTTLDVAEAPPPGGATHLPGIEAGAAAEADEPAPGPRIAYTYRFGYTLSAGSIAAVQQRHIAMCDALGAARCRIVSMVREASQGSHATAGLHLLVDARIARRFGERLDAEVTGAGGAVGSRATEAEDLSKQIVDTAARVRAKEALAERLLALLRTRDGKVGELVEAERAFAEAQEELDAARTWLAEMEQRVALSKVEIGYASPAPVGGGLVQPVREAAGDAGEVLGDSLAFLIRLIVAALPWGLLAALLVWALRRFGFRGPRLSGRWWRGRRRAAGAGEAARPADQV
jgi:hypothetical protein